MTPGDVADALGQGGHGHPEGQGDADEVGLAGVAQAGAAADEDEEEGADELGHETLGQVQLGLKLLEAEAGEVFGGHGGSDLVGLQMENLDIMPVCKYSRMCLRT